MSKFVGSLMGILICIVAPLWYGYVLCDDLAHPEIWDSDWMHDPRAYLPYTATLLVLVLALVIKKRIDDQRPKR